MNGLLVLSALALVLVVRWLRAPMPFHELGRVPLLLHLSRLEGRKPSVGLRVRFAIVAALDWIARRRS